MPLKNWKLTNSSLKDYIFVNTKNNSDMIHVAFIRIPKKLWAVWYDTTSVVKKDIYSDKASALRAAKSFMKFH